MLFCDDTAITTIFKRINNEFKYVDASNASKFAIPPHLANDTDVCLFLTSVIRIQLEMRNLQSKELKYSKHEKMCFCKSCKYKTFYLI